MEVKKIDNVKVNPSSLVRVKEMGNITEIMWSDSYTSKCSIRKIDKDHYIQLDTGEMKEFKHIENRACDLKSISKSLGRLRDYLNTNIIDVSKCRWVTLTYKQRESMADDKVPMTDTKRLYEDFKKFNKRLRYHIGAYEYIVAMEPQGTGSWHAHVVMLFEDKAPYIPNELMAKVWGNGYVTVKKLDDVDNVGAYLTAYLGDMEMQEFAKTDKIHEVIGKRVEIKEVQIEEDGIQKTKQYIKGARLYMYPPQFNLYRCSRGIKKPIVTYEHEVQAQKKVSAGTLTFEKTILLAEPENDFEKTINYRYYNKIRKQ